MRQFTFFAPMADAIIYYHTRWEDLKNLTLPEKTKIHANFIVLVDRVDALATLHPGLVDNFITSSSSEAF